MPWYVLTYLFLFALMTIGSTYEDIKEKQPAFHVIGNIASLIFVSLFCYSYFNPDYAAQIGSRFIPMLVLGFIWEVYIATIDINDVSDDTELNEGEMKVVTFLSHTTIACFTLLGYIPGVFLAWEYLQ